ncbi:hypothetical protein COLO4_28081 [Corchorus olitorius]|uniref:Uncharacterized protein n=1 Tax=Corchorus olitorius TaxID=93759 RepID=A0A1R3HN38_9ROSI|nr:hypothetical protein COLO4_28081 [Corchorus olitorius]
MYNIDSSKKIYLHDLVIDLQKIDAKSNEFKAKFVLYRIGCLLCPWSATYVESALLSYLNKKVLKCEVDWASHVHKMLWSGIDELQRSVGRQYVSGCIIILQVIYANIVSGNRERRRGCRPCKSLATSWGVQGMNILISSIDDYGIERMDLREEVKPYHHDGQRDECNKEKHGSEEEIILSSYEDCEDVECSSFFGDCYQHCPMKEDVRRSPKEKMEMKASHVHIKSMEFRHDFKESVLHGGDEFCYLQPNNGNYGHDAFETFESTPSKKESNRDEKMKGRPKGWSSKKCSPKDCSSRQTFWSNIKKDEFGYPKEDDLCSPRHPSRFLFTLPLRYRRKQKKLDFFFKKRGIDVDNSECETETPTKSPRVEDQLPNESPKSPPNVVEEPEPEMDPGLR